MPGALLGNRLKINPKRLLAMADSAIIALMASFALALQKIGHGLPAAFFLSFGFVISLICGFPVALRIQGDDTPAATRFFRQILSVQRQEPC